MRIMTEDDLKIAFAGESQAHIKYLIFAEVAEKENKPNLARLLRAISHAEFVHAKNHFRALGNIKKSDENLVNAYDGENYEVEEMYPVFNNTAKFQNEKQAEISTHFALETEKIHRDIYSKAIELNKQDKDFTDQHIFICPVCGHTHLGDEAPDKCPICGCPKDKYIKF